MFICKSSYCLLRMRSFLVSGPRRLLGSNDKVQLYFDFLDGPTYTFHGQMNHTGGVNGCTVSGHMASVVM